MTKARLRSYRMNKLERVQLQQRLEELEAEMYAPRIQRLTGMPSAPAKDNPLESLAVRHAELLDRYRAKLDELATEQLAIEQAIDSLDPTARLILRHYYIEGLTWEEVCCAVNYGWAQVHRIHSRALIALGDRQKRE